MNKPDARHLTIETQNYLRQQAIRLREQGKPVKAISEYLGVHRNTVWDWWWEYEHYGETALSQQQRGRQVGEGRILTASDEAAVQAAMQRHFPEDYGIDSALWTRRAVQALIGQRCGVAMPIRTVGEYLKRWGYKPKKPLERAYEQDPQAVEAWLETEYAQIEQRAEAEGAEMRFMLYTCSLAAEQFIRFCERLIAHRQHKLFWIVDRHPVHRQVVVKHWLQAHKEQIELFYLPSYSPQLNPVEYFNGDVKQGVHDKPPTRNLSQLKARVLSQLRKLQKLPARVRNYFKHPSIAYAAL